MSTPARFSLAGRVALVTGGARGCGLAFARGLAEAGAAVAIFDVLAPSAPFHELAAAHGVRTAHYAVDVSSLESLAAGFAALAADFDGRLDVCVACAGTNRPMLDFLDTPLAEFDAVHAVNVRGVFFTAQLAAKHMIASGTTKGSIVVVASIASHVAIRS